ncbi:DoxX family protein [Streptomyces sp. NPDC007084]|uniref:DoxX family protein n=1 Tax=Streptomyces sp. NPDC007084 TaxID=3154313 RepID=UPI003456A7F0
MNIAAWIVSVLVAVMFLGAGAMKLRKSKKQILEDPKMGWAQDFSEPMIKFIGFAEVAGAIGIVLPWAVDVLPALSPIAGYGLAVLMVGAVIVHARRREFAAIPVGFLFTAAPLFVAIARTGAF